MRLPAALAILALTLQVPVQPPRDPGRRPPPDPTGTATIRGHVVAADSGSPVAHASVTIMPVDPPLQLNSDSAVNGAPGGVAPPVLRPRPKTATTDSQGTFTFPNLPAGSYHIRASPSSYAAQYLSIAYGAKKPSAFGTSDPGKQIDVADGQAIGNIMIALPRGSVIAGRVTDETGAPLARVQIRAALVMPGNPRSFAIGNGSTDDRGQFRLFGLQPGDYVITAEGRNNTFIPPNMLAQPEQDEVGLLTTYYPGTANEGEAQRVHVDAGAEISGADIRMMAGRLFHVSGTIVDSQGQPARASGSLQYRTSGMTTQSFGFSVDPQGHFQMQNVAPGEYRLVARSVINGQPGLPGLVGIDQSAPIPETASVPLTVNGDVDDIYVRLSPGATITGQIQFDGEPAVPAGNQPPQLRVSAQAGDPVNQMGLAPARPALVNPDLTFTLKGLQGESLLRTSAPGTTLKSVLLGGEDITDTPHEFKDGERVIIVLTTHTSTVQGTVADDKGAPAMDASILMFSDDKATWHGNSVHMRRSSVDQIGQFRLQQVLPGNYLILAMPREALTMPLMDPSAFEQFVRYATPVAVGDGEQRTINLKVVTPNGGGL